MRRWRLTQGRGAAGGRTRRADQRGEALILALVLMLVGAVAAGALSYEVTTGLSSTGEFANARSLEYAARSATNVAIQNIRYTPLLSQTLNASPPVPCWGTAAISEVSNVDGVAPMAVWCSTAWTPTSSSTRTVTFSTCLDSGQSAAVQAATCAADPYLEAVVVFDDYPIGVSAPSNAPCQVYCGTGMSITSWLWDPTVPTVSALSPSGGSVSGGTSVTITGTGFQSGATVSFIEESGGVPSSSNVVLAATNVVVHSATSITATAPAATQGSTYDVVVTTPSGESAQVAAAVYTYQLVAPTISSLSPTSGVTAGGNSITVTGSGFMTPVTVKFVPESGGAPIAGGTALTGEYVNVTSSTSLTVVSPGTTSGTTYFVTVRTPGGVTAENAASVFTYEYIVPTVNLISPASGPASGGTTVTITGTGFITGAAVYFIRESSGCPGGNQYPVSSAVSASISQITPTTITATTPSVAYGGGAYYVYVTTTQGGSYNNSSCFPIFTYTG